MTEIRVPVSDFMAKASGAEWKQYWRGAVESRGHEVVSTDDEICQIFLDGQTFIVGEVK